MKPDFEREIRPQILETLDEKTITILYGPRQVGKTTLVRKILSTVPKSHYFQCDDPADRLDIEGKSIVELQHLLAGFDLVVIDEAQKIPDIGTTLKLIADGVPNVRVIATGSSSFALANRVNEPLTGRNRKYHLYPLSVRELLGIYPEHAVARNIDNYLRFGMYPSVVTTDTPESKERELRTLAEDYLYRDLLSYDGIRNTEILGKLIRMLALQVGSEVSYAKLAHELGIARDTVYHYVTLLEQAFIVFRVTPFYTNKIKEITKTHKIYFYDTGVRNAVIGNFLPFDIRDDRGAVFENFFIAERFKRKMYDNGTHTLHFWRAHNDSEVDLVEIDAGGTRIQSFECKWRDVVSAPGVWRTAYPDAGFSCVTRDTCVSFLK